MLGGWPTLWMVRVPYPLRFLQRVGGAEGWLNHELLKLLVQNCGARGAEFENRLPVPTNFQQLTVP